MNQFFPLLAAFLTLIPSARAESNFVTIKFVASPSVETPSGVPFVRQPSVALVDKHGNLVPTNSSCVVTLSLVGGDRGDVLGGSSLSVVMVNGRADFTDLRVFRSAESQGPMSYRLLATPGGDCEGLRGGGPFESEAFTITTAGLPNHLVLKQAPSDATLDQVWARQPVLAVVDVDGNVVSSDNSTIVTVRKSEDSPDGLLCGTISRVVTSGIATFNDLYVYGGDQSDDSLGSYEYIFEGINPPYRLAGVTIGGQVISKK